MKPPFPTCFVASAMLALGGVSQGQNITIEWGGIAPLDNTFVNSDGVELGVGIGESFIFELGAFANSFDPSLNEPGDWFSNWMVFDRADYDPANLSFSGSAVMQLDGTSNSPDASPLGASFAGLDAYLWVYKGTDPVPGSEWLLVRASSWTFPTPGEECCPGDKLQWSISDLTATDTPVWGNQGGQLGGGVNYTPTDDFTLQTHTFIPEPSSFLFTLMASGLLFVRRRTA
jgi:hypothetical protein